MGQYYLIVNPDKKQYLYSHTFGDGLKLLEFGCSAYGMLTGLTLLLADGNGRGGGDFRLHDELRGAEPVDTSLVGSWAGDRIVFAGDYADPGRFTTVEGVLAYRAKHDKPEDLPSNPNLYALAHDQFEDISPRVVMLMAQDSWLRERLILRGAWAPDLEVPRSRFEPTFWVGGRWVTYKDARMTGTPGWYDVETDNMIDEPWPLARMKDSESLSEMARNNAA